MNESGREQPLISIIMGVYNCEKTVRQSVESIRSQTYSNWEFIICDDCSTDDTLSILRELRKMDDRIHIIRNRRNLRLAASLNHCLKKSGGKYIARMDADDECFPDRIEKQVYFLEKHPEYAVVGTTQYVFNDRGFKYIQGRPKIPGKQTLVMDVPFAHPTIMMRKEVYDALDGYDEKMFRSEDLELWFRFYAKGYKGYNIQEPLYKYREDDNSYSKRTLQAALKTSKVFWEGYTKLGIPLLLRVFALKPVVSALMPNCFIDRFHKYKSVRRSR